MSAALQRLATWFSPAFPVGTFAWSQGLETAIADGRVTTAATLRDWLAGALAHGGLRTDAIILAQAHRAHTDADALRELADLMLALTAASERRLETTLTGEAFAIAARAWPSDVFARLPDPCPYPVAAGAVAGAAGIALDDLLPVYLTAAVQTQVSVAVRLVPLGQTAGLQVIAGLEAMVATAAAEAASASLDDIGGIAYAADIAQMRHETIEPRIFRS
ncbi:MAG TPA: urease accessory UreF family protein [Devosia sp.]|nr:urease accessory UreF family protein [Devosia sp.]